MPGSLLTMAGRPKGSKTRPGIPGTRFTLARQKAYCADLALHGEWAKACATIGCSHATIHRHRGDDPNFRAMEDEALSIYRASLGQEIHRRGVDGVDEPIYWNGNLVGWKRKYSDALLIAHAKRHMREEYGEKVQVDQTTHVVGDPMAIAMEKLSPQSRALLRTILENESGKETTPE